MTVDTDIAIAGGGPVGAALALALRDSGLRVTLLEARAADALRTAHDPRPIAISYGGRLLLERLGAWQALAPTAIDHIHISQRGGFGRAALSAAACGVPALGYVTDYSKVHAALTDAVRTADVDYLDAARVTAVIPGSERSGIEYSRHGVRAALSARLTVVADGGDIDGLSPAHVTDYGQCAVTARVRTARPHRNTAYERFTHEGPLALLPFGADMALVWTLPPARAQTLQHMDSGEFLAALRAAFGGRLGEFTAVAQRATFALALRRAAPDNPPRVVAIGNAAQTLHPVAGQGFNLGLRDAWELAQMLRAAPDRDPGAHEALHRFAAARRIDRRTTVGTTHALVRIFSNDFFALGTLRGAAMTLLGCVPPVRDVVARRMIFGTRG